MNYMVISLTYMCASEKCQCLQNIYTELPIILTFFKDLFRTAIHNFWSAIYSLMQVKIKLSTTICSGFMEAE